MGCRGQNGLRKLRIEQEGPASRPGFFYSTRRYRKLLPIFARHGFFGQLLKSVARTQHGNYAKTPCESRTRLLISPPRRHASAVFDGGWKRRVRPLSGRSNARNEVDSMPWLTLVILFRTAAQQDFEKSSATAGNIGRNPYCVRFCAALD